MEGLTGATLNLQTGSYSGDVLFSVHANVEYVNFEVWVTPLFKADDPRSTAQVPVDAERGVIVAPQSMGQPVPIGSTGDEMLTGLPGGLEWPSSKFGPGSVESGQSFVFSQDVVITVPYINTDAELPQGEYSGWVKVRSFI